MLSKLFHPTIELRSPRRRLARVAAAISGLLVAAAGALSATPAAAVNIVTIQQVSSGRFLDAHEIEGMDYRLVTRPAQNNSTQYWRMVPLGGNVYTLQQMSNNRFVDAHEYDAADWHLVTRTAQNNDTQRWIFTAQGGNIFTIQQVSNGRYVDAHETDTADFGVVTRTWQGNSTQQWRVVTVFTEPDPVVVPPVSSSGSFQIIPQQQVNLDNGQVGPGGGADLGYQVQGFTRQIAPINGAQMSFTNGAQRGFVGCSAAAFSSSAVPQANLSVGNYVCIRTNNGRISEMRIDAIGQLIGALTISYTTW
ncbi:MAG: RICIN domain-containing protein [Bauldia sp.]|nr:RICIN domain-containing protein [Bauldia sp.]